MRAKIDWTLLVDSSYSVRRVKLGVIMGVNRLLRSLVDEPGIVLSLADFNNYLTVRHEETPVNKVKILTVESFIPVNSTALLDSFATILNNTDVRLDAKDIKDYPDRVVITLFGGGEDTISSNFNVKQVETMVNYSRDENEWEFVYLGMNKDAQHVASRLGIDKGKALTLGTTPLKVQTGLEAMRALILDPEVEFTEADRSVQEGE